MILSYISHKIKGFLAKINPVNIVKSIKQDYAVYYFTTFTQNRDKGNAEKIFNAHKEKEKSLAQSRIQQIKELEQSIGESNLPEHIIVKRDSLKKKYSI